MVGCAARCLAVSTQRWYRSKPFVKTTSVARHLLSFHVGVPEFVTQVSRELNPTVGVVVLVNASPALLTPVDSDGCVPRSRVIRKGASAKNRSAIDFDIVDDRQRLDSAQAKKIFDLCSCYRTRPGEPKVANAIS